MLRFLIGYAVKHPVRCIVVGLGLGGAILVDIHWPKFYPWFMTVFASLSAVANEGFQKLRDLANVAARILPKPAVSASQAPSAPQPKVPTHMTTPPPSFLDDLEGALSGIVAAGAAAAEPILAQAAAASADAILTAVKAKVAELPEPYAGLASGYIASLPAPTPATIETWVANVSAYFRSFVPAAKAPSIEPARLVPMSEGTV